MPECYSPNPVVMADYHAHRYRQMKELTRTLPFWEYRHNHGCEVEGCEHIAWDGLVLDHDDPWWDEHYPKICGCYVSALNARDLGRLGKTGPDPAPVQ